MSVYIWVRIFTAIIAWTCLEAYEHGRWRPGMARTPLDDYMDRPEPVYGWTTFDNITYFDNSTVYYLNVTTLEWVDGNWSDHVVWWHYVAVAIPNTVRFPDTSLMFLGGGENKDDNIPFPERDFLTAAIASMSEDVGLVCVYYKQLPNQPITFVGDHQEGDRSEDSLIAYTWRKFIDDPSDPEILARMPMTKAVVKGMDAITEFTRQQEPTLNISKYIISGPSKRGWTSWTAAAVDSRVIAQAPMVLTCLDFVSNLHHHYMSLGGWSFALTPYYNENLTRDLDHPNTQLMMDIVDPYAYIDRYTMPTMVFAAAEDQFFLPDDSWFFFNQLPGPKFMMLLDNTDHTLFPYTHVYRYMRGFLLALLSPEEYEMPVTSWDILQDAVEGTGTIIFYSDKPPTDVVAWWANTTDGARRDFRANQGPDADPSFIRWEMESVEDLGENTFAVEFDEPTVGWRGFFIEATYEGAEGDTFTVTSEINIIPNTFPYPDCSGTDCYGVIV